MYLFYFFLVSIFELIKFFFYVDRVKIVKLIIIRIYKYFFYEVFFYVFMDIKIDDDKVCYFLKRI